MGISSVFFLNFNIFESNILNLAFVIAILVTVVGDVFKEFLEQRRSIIFLVLKKANIKKEEANKIIIEAKKMVEKAYFKSEEVFKKGNKEREKENKIVKIKIKKYIENVKEQIKKNIEIEYKKAKKKYSTKNHQNFYKLCRKKTSKNI